MRNLEIQYRVKNSCFDPLIFCAPGFRANLPAGQGHRVAHKFTVGQTVDLTRTIMRPSAPGKYEIRRLMPASDIDPSNPSYRVKNVGESYERVVRESEIVLTDGPKPTFS